MKKRCMSLLALFLTLSMLLTGAWAEEDVNFDEFEYVPEEEVEEIEEFMIGGEAEESSLAVVDDDDSDDAFEAAEPSDLDNWDAYDFAEEGTSADAAMAASSDFVIENGVLVNYKGAGGDIVIPNGVIEIGSFFCQHKVNRFDECYDNTITSVTIPSSVKKIDDDAFNQCLSIKSIVFSEGLEEVGERAFKWCDALETVVFPESLNVLGDMAFYGCTSLRSVKMPTYMKAYGVDTAHADEWDSGVFPGCEKLTTINLPITASNPGGIDYIPFGLFRGCESLESVVIPEGTRTIDKCAFSDNALKRVQIPDSVVEIEDGAFGLNTSYTIVCNAGSYAESYAKNNGITCELLNSTSNLSDFVIENGVLVDYVGPGGEVVIPSGVKEVAQEAFAYYTVDEDEERNPITRIVFPEGLISIGDQSCDHLYELKSVVIPASVTSIGDGAFESCVKLESITIPSSGLITIKPFAFWNCGLKSFNIPNTVTTIGSSAFGLCSNLKSIVIPNGVSRIEEETFLSAGLTSITIPNSVTYIDDGIFEIAGAGFYDIDALTIYCNSGSAAHSFAIKKGYNYYLMDSSSDTTDFVIKNGVLVKYNGPGGKVTIPSGVTTIGEEAFFPREDVTSVIIPNGVKTIEASAFNHCTGLTSISIPNSVTSIGECAFEQCGLTSIVIPNSVTSLGDGVFSDCGNLKSVTLPNTLTAIPDSMFWYCDSLTSINIPSTVTRIGEDAFTECRNLTITTPCGSYAQKWATQHGTKLSITHSAVSVAAVPATCTKTGTAAGTKCKVCGIVLSGCATVPKTAHKAVTVKGKVATCTATGLTDGTKCSVCGVTLKAQTTIAKKAHTPVTVKGRAATYTAAGLTDGVKCSVCGTWITPQRAIAQLQYPTRVLDRNKNNGTVTVNVGDRIRLVPQFATSTGASVTGYKSGKVKFATVDGGGLVTAVAEGKAKITVTTNNKKTKATITVQVVDPYKPTGISINQGKTVTLTMGQTLQLGAQLAPASARATLTWKSSKPKVVTVDGSGRLVPVGEGKAKITVTTHNKKKATITVQVVDPYKPLGISINQGKTVTLKVGQTLRLGTTLNPTSARTALTWKSAKPAIATVDGNGNVCAVKKGKTKITVTTYNKKKATITVNVVE